MKQRIEDYPEDFQQLLLDEMPFDMGDEAEVFIANCADHFQELGDDLAHWGEDDFDKAVEFIQRLLNNHTFPPLVAEMPKGLLVDGYHRLFAYRALGITQCEMIYKYPQDEYGEPENE